mmetsp:Transcript_12596/g.25105  ORF Transcript_12596/g.25105 Transcript_12596/m.25105 type:complete len:100 (-) Transcript_12596:614-913(-)
MASLSHHVWRWSLELVVFHPLLILHLSFQLRQMMARVNVVKEEVEGAEVVDEVEEGAEEDVEVGMVEVEVEGIAIEQGATMIGLRRQFRRVECVNDIRD